MVLLIAYAAKLALVIHSMQWATSDLGSESRLRAVADDNVMHAGIELAEWFQHETRRLYTDQGVDNDDTELRKRAH